MTRSRFKRLMVVLITISFLAGLRLALPERSATDTGARALADSLFAIGLLATILGSALGTGNWVSRRLGLTYLVEAERIAFGTAAGLGILAYGLLFLGLFGLLRPDLILLWVGAFVGFGLYEWITGHAPARDLLYRLRSAGRGAVLAMVATALIFLLSGIQALAPVWDYDGLMYHLQAPRLFLEAGRIELLPDLWQANGPLSPEMLYTIGVAFGSDSFAKLVHLSFAGLLLLSTFAVARVYLGGFAGWLAAGVLLGIPIFPIWGSLAYSDMAWALYEFLAVAAILRWRDSRHAGWIVLAGIMMGLALGSKLVALGMFPILIFWIVWFERQNGYKFVLRIGSLFVIPAAAFALPWFAKNWLLSGNPVYPFVFGGPGWPPERLELLLAYLRSFGTGMSLADLPSLPWNLYSKRVVFGTFMTSVDMPSVLFPVALLFPFFAGGNRLREVGGIILLRFLVWAAVTQQTRFLLPLYPLLSVWAAGMLAGLADKFPSRLVRTSCVGIVAGLVCATLVYQVIYFRSKSPIDVVIGRESKDSFLRREVYDYGAARYITENLGANEHAYLMWDGQAYYCDDRCLPDADQSRWTQLVSRAPSSTALADELQDLGVTHMLLDVEGLNFMLHHDPTGKHREAAAFTFERFIPHCLQEVVSFPKVRLFRLSCSQGA